MSKPDWKIIEGTDGVDFLETHGGCFKLPLYRYEGMRLRRLVVETDRTPDVCDKLIQLRQDEAHVRAQLGVWVDDVVAENGEGVALLEFIPSNGVYRVCLRLTFDGVGFNRSGADADVRLAGKFAFEAMGEAMRNYENQMQAIVSGKPALRLVN